ncbi:hypothetical protein GOODEAATRI_017227 [Goodea atripinnis]|uniref:Secreted protein n=1 Tax=Goodea atripinnis TaxID=208336 RepID=A0ABV0N261_9TELE
MVISLVCVWSVDSQTFYTWRRPGSGGKTEKTDTGKRETSVKSKSSRTREKICTFFSILLSNSSLQASDCGNSMASPAIACLYLRNALSGSRFSHLCPIVRTLKWLDFHAVWKSLKSDAGFSHCYHNTVRPLKN